MLMDMEHKVFGIFPSLFPVSVSSIVKSLPDGSSGLPSLVAIQHSANAVLTAKTAVGPRQKAGPSFFCHDHLTGYTSIKKYAKVSCFGALAQPVRATES